MSNPSVDEAPGTQNHDKQFRIVVNGQEKTVASEIVSYDDVVRLAFPAGEANTIYRVTFRKAKHPHEGTLVEGQSVEIHNNTIFDVTPTGKS